MNATHVQKLEAAQRIEILLAEYHSINELLLFRLNVLDRRLPAAGAFITLGLAAVGSLPFHTQTVVLVCTPMFLLWLTRTTAQHAKAKADNLRRIAEIESSVNEIANEELMQFQSRHPNLGSTPAGRTGQATIATTTYGSVVVLLFSVVIFHQYSREIPALLFDLYVVISLVGIATAPLSVASYRYRKPGPKIVHP
ncbi:MAG: hypothetical protein NXI32_15255 [bacterium]|nr:hypothetical protein [bacterium]